MIFEDGRRALRLLDRRQLEPALLLGARNTPLDIPNGVREFVDLGAIPRAQLALQARELVLDRIENALVLPKPRFARLAIGAAAVAEQPFEDGARVPLHRQRLRGAAPRQRVRVDATQIARAG